MSGPFRDSRPLRRVFTPRVRRGLVHHVVQWAIVIFGVVLIALVAALTGPPPTVAPTASCRDTSMVMAPGAQFTCQPDQRMSWFADEHDTVVVYCTCDIAWWEEARR